MLFLLLGTMLGVCESPDEGAGNDAGVNSSTETTDETPASTWAPAAGGCIQATYDECFASMPAGEQCSDGEPILVAAAGTVHFDLSALAESGIGLEKGDWHWRYAQKASCCKGYVIIDDWCWTSGVVCKGPFICEFSKKGAPCIDSYEEWFYDEALKPLCSNGPFDILCINCLAPGVSDFEGADMPEPSMMVGPGKECSVYSGYCEAGEEPVCDFSSPVKTITLQATDGCVSASCGGEQSSGQCFTTWNWQ